jgi:hypothetical protein
LHDDRSVYDIDENKVVLRKSLAMEYSFKDPEVVRKFGRQKKKMIAYSDTYNSLHLALAGKSGRSFFYLWKAFKIYPVSVCERRTLAIFKYYFMRLFKII